MKLLFFGGVQGVGKTTLLTWLKNQYPKIQLLDAGELFRRYHYQKRLKPAEEVEELIVNKLLTAPADSVIAVHWHYAVRRPAGYIPQINFSRFKRLANSGKIKRVFLFLTEAPAKLIRQRRLSDRQIKKRALVLTAIRAEIRKEKEFFAKEHRLFLRRLGKEKVRTFRLINADLPTAKARLRQILKTL